MPYRRLPNTDQARIRALKAAVEKADVYNMHNLAVSLNLLTEARNFLARFEAAQMYYKQCFENQIKSSHKCRTAVKNARLYISHFIQVLNLSTIRSEIKEDCKVMYGLSAGCSCIPDLMSETSVLEWGEKIIKGEKERLKKGGIPIYNPTIAKVSVHYDIFKESFLRQKELQAITARSLNALSLMRHNADEIILKIWDQAEAFFADLNQEEKLEKANEYGVIYYYRTNEKKLDDK